VVRGPSVMSGYIDDPKANEEVFQGGWLHTGDLLRRQVDGSLTYVDRKRYLIKTGGENVYPAEVEVEVVMARRPAMQEACVFGVPDAYWSETIKAVVVLRHGAQATGEDIVAWRRELAKWPVTDDQRECSAARMSVVRPRRFALAPRLSLCCTCVL
jgi:acyl-CoA synthetase (AMP-forming)/AMP-acid ligase II